MAEAVDVPEESGMTERETAGDGTSGPDTSGPKTPTRRFYANLADL